MSSDNPLKYELHAVWPEADSATQTDVIRFWENEGAIDSPQERRARAKELLVVARGVRNQIVAVSTAAPRFVKQLGFECFHYRTFTGTKNRGAGLRGSDVLTTLYRDSYRHLNSRFLQGHDPQVLGLYFEIENPALARYLNRLVWSEYGVDVIYLGISERGLHQRVSYFENSRIPGSGPTRMLPPAR
ncbi:MAG: hypothetical protein U0903_03700 [Planctomycetales bacterium]